MWEQIAGTLMPLHSPPGPRHLQFWVRKASKLPWRSMVVAVMILGMVVVRGRMMVEMVMMVIGKIGMVMVMMKIVLMVMVMTIVIVLAKTLPVMTVVTGNKCGVSSLPLGLCLL